MRLDPVSGDYFILVYDDQDNPIEARLVPADKVLAQVWVSVSNDVLHREFVYRVAVAPDSPQSLETFRVGCPLERAAENIEARDVTTAGSESWRTDHADYGATGAVCYFSGGTAAVVPGRTLEASFLTPMLPAIGPALLTGAGAGIVGGIPATEIASDGNLDAIAFEGSVIGITGGWKEITSIVPTRDPALFADPADGLSLIQGDLTEACGTLGWISSTEVCAQLSSELAESATSVTAAAWREARSALSDFLTTLEAQHDSAGPETVDGNAFALLATNARFVLDRLPNPPTSAAGGPCAAVEGSSVTLNGTTSADSDGTPLTFAWDFGDGQAGIGATPTHTYADDGTCEPESDEREHVEHAEARVSRTG